MQLLRPVPLPDPRGLFRIRPIGRREKLQHIRRVLRSAFRHVLRRQYERADHGDERRYPDGEEASDIGRRDDNPPLPDPFAIRIRAVRIPKRRPRRERRRTRVATLASPRRLPRHRLLLPAGAVGILLRVRYCDTIHLGISVHSHDEIPDTRGDEPERLLGTTMERPGTRGDEAGIVQARETTYVRIRQSRRRWRCSSRAASSTSGSCTPASCTGSSMTTTTAIIAES